MSHSAPPHCCCCCISTRRLISRASSLHPSTAGRAYFLKIGASEPREKSTDSNACPADYGNEKECGEGVARAIKDGLVKREELFIVSKLWNSFHDGDRVEPICKKQLADWYVSHEINLPSMACCGVTLERFEPCTYKPHEQGLIEQLRQLRGCICFWNMSHVTAH